MTTGRLPRRLVVGATAAALLGGAVGFLPLLGSASAAACPTWTDPAGDSGLVLPAQGTPAGESEPTGKSADDDLDVVRTTVSPDALGGLVVQVKVTALSEGGPNNTPGEQFAVSFNAAGAAIKVSLARDVLAGDEFTTLTGTATSSGKVVYDFKASTVTGTFTGDQVKAAVGKPLAGLKLDTFKTLVYGYTEYPVSPPAGTLAKGLGFPLTEQSTAPTSLVYTDAGGCGGADAGTPAPTESQSASPTPTATPSETPSPTPTAVALFDQPRKGCVQYKDPTGDADPTPTGQDNEGSLDVTQVNLKSTSGALQVFVGLVAPDEAMFQAWNGRVYVLTLTVGGKAVALTATGDGAAAATVGGAANSDIKATAKVDAKAKNIVFTVPLDGLSKATATAVAAGTPITGTTVDTKANSQLGARAADNAAGKTDAEKTYAYGDNSCFLPPVGAFEVDADPSGQYGDTTEVFATLTDVDGAPVEGATVTGTLPGGTAASAVTDADGLADLLVPLTVKAGASSLTVTFAGNQDVGLTTASQPFTVAAEKTVLKAVATRGGAQATVLDDDKHPVVGRPVTFLVGSKKTIVKTNAKGVAVLTKVAKGTAVKVSFAAVPGYYLGTPTATVKAA